MLNELIGFFDLARDILRERWAFLLFALAVLVVVIGLSVAVFGSASAVTNTERTVFDTYLARAGR